MFSSTLPVALTLFLIVPASTQNLDSGTGHRHQPDTAPDLDLVPARRIPPLQTTTTRHYHRHHHVDDFALPTPTYYPYNYEDYDEYTTDADHSVRRGWESTESPESGDYDKMAAHTDKEELTENKLPSRSPTSRCSCLFLLLFLATRLFPVLLFP